MKFSLDQTIKKIFHPWVWVTKLDFKNLEKDKIAWNLYERSKSKKKMFYKKDP